MTEVRKLWTCDLPEMPEDELERIRDTGGGEFSQAAQCFWLFRILHRYETAVAVLLGDYCFGRFSEHLSALDNVALTNSYSAFLKKDTRTPGGIEEYIDFLREASELI